MRFSFLTVIVALAASIMFVSTSKIPTRPGGGTLSYGALPESRDQNTKFVSDDEYSHDAIKGAGRFARRGGLMGVSGLYEQSGIGEIEENSKSKNSDGVGHRRSEIGENAKSKSSDGVGHRRSEIGEIGENAKSKSSGGVGHRRSEIGEIGENAKSKSSDGVGHRRSEIGENAKSKSSDGVGHRRSEMEEVGLKLPSGSSDGVGH